MGEIRPGHFHGGLDIKTEGVEGLPVYAAEDGYIYRIKVSTRGYGRALYMQHRDGSRTLYGHLKSFDDRLESYKLQKHYEEEEFELDIFPDENMFRYKKGDVIAFSGNTGSSGGPHLHFEIRRNDDAVMNPLKYNFNEIRDNIAPIPSRVAIVPKNPESRINGTFGRLELPLYRSGNTYTNRAVIKAHGTVGIEFQGIDRANMTSNTYGINKVVMEVNGKEIYRHEIGLVPFEITRMINLFVDYKTWQKTYKRFQRCYKVDGNLLPFYDESPSSGFFTVPESGLYKVVIHLYDSYDNHSKIELNLQGAPQNITPEVPLPKTDDDLLNENTYVFSAYSPTATVYIKDETEPVEIEADYKVGGESFFTWDMRLGLPDSVICNAQVIKNNYVNTIMPFANTTYFNDIAEVKIPQNALSDTLYLEMSTDASNKVYSFGDEDIPLFAPVSFTIKPTNREIDNSYQMYSLSRRGNHPSYVGGEWKDGKITFKTRSFGRFVFLQDNVMPSLRVIRRDASSFVCRIGDGLSGISDFRATINGDWLLMQYDYRKGLIWSERLNKSKPLKGTLELRVKDNAGNERVYRSFL
ncbi:M23 family metallopeptidase [Chondrinema litorale]|uniref:M23 family metallopeptidase n=1 Tax=Chondrinema litorale TaxID=2994555 RepID=UPI002543C42C|nr:M23 family metallopeptidase [Chondrinema litorale]UZR93550.1 M23 family metallopeptidase [Chondrinema litorale]